MENKVIFILGPTSSGKTALSLEIAAKYNGEIVNIDSQQAVTGLNIATSKLPFEKRKNIPHHLFDIYDLTDQQNVYDFCERAESVIKGVLVRNKLPIVVGGTGMYARILSGAIEVSDERSDLEQRKELEKLSVEDLQKKLSELSELESLNESDKQNKRRLIRKIEKFGQNSGATRVFLKDHELLKIAKELPQDIREVIRSNVQNMLAQGLIEETKTLMAKYPNFLELVKAIGYKETAAYLNGELKSEKELIDLITTHTYQYAKRQMTWLKKEPNIKWIASDEEGLTIVEDFLA